MDALRKPFLFLAIALMVVTVAVEIGAGAFLRGVPPVGNVMGAITGALPDSLREALDDVDSGDVEDLASASEDVPGLGIPYMALLDGVVLFTVGLIATSLIITDRVQGRVQGCATFVISLLLILLSIALIIAAIILLLLMIALLLAVPFGTIAYMAIYGFFDRAGAAGVLSILMLLKLGFAISLVLAQQRFLQNRGLVLLVLCSLLGNIVISFLHGLVPNVLVSITDAVAAILVGACGCIWWILAIIGSIPAILKIIRARA